MKKWGLWLLTARTPFLKGGSAVACCCALIIQDEGLRFVLTNFFLDNLKIETGVTSSAFAVPFCFFPNHSTINSSSEVKKKEYSGAHSRVATLIQPSFQRKKEKNRATSDTPFSLLKDHLEVPSFTFFFSFWSIWGAEVRFLDICILCSKKLEICTLVSSVVDVSNVFIRTLPAA